jgi:hypothetical protein
MGIFGKGQRSFLQLFLYLLLHLELGGLVFAFLPIGR